MKPAATSPMTVDESIPKTCTVAQVCRILQLSRRRFYELLASGQIPFSEIKPRIGTPRFRGEDLQLWLEGGYATRGLRIARSR